MRIEIYAREDFEVTYGGGMLIVDVPEDTAVRVRRSAEMSGDMPSAVGAVCLALREGGEMTVRQLEEATGMRASRVDRALRRGEGTMFTRVGEEREGHGRPAHRWGLLEEGARWANNHRHRITIPN